MDNAQAVTLIKSITSGVSPKVDFISPAVSTILAAQRVADQAMPTAVFGEDAQKYASNIGLVEALDQKFAPLLRCRGLQGETYSPLTMLYDNPHVEQCASTINSLFNSQLKGYDRNLMKQLAYVVGELHDNVVSHAKGSGFSAAQTYVNKAGGHRVIFAIADAGVGLLNNYRKKFPQSNNHGDALGWCLQKGNTTAKPMDKSAQRPYDDAVRSPYGEDVPIRIRECDHMGYGLWDLCETVDQANGRLWMWTGDVQYSRNKGSGITTWSNVIWRGLAIEVEFQVSRETKTRFEGHGAEDIFSGR